MRPARAILTVPALTAALLLGACQDEILYDAPADVPEPRLSVTPLSGPIDNPYGLAVGTFGTIAPEVPSGQDVGPVTAQWIQEAGIRWVRLTTYWYGVEPGHGVWDLTPIDRQVQMAASKGLNVQMDLFGTPCWARADPNATPCHTSPPNLDRWADFVQTMVTRYPGIKHWSIWNEPNVSAFWSGTSQQYVDLTNRAAPIIRAAGGRVVAPELAAESGARDFLGFVLNHAGHNIDIVSTHAYTSNISNPQGIAQWVYDMTVLTPVAAAWRWPIWLTEAGLISCENPADSTHTHDNGDDCSGPSLDDSYQASKLQELMDAMMTSQTPFWQRTFYWHMADEYDPSTSPPTLLADRGIIANYGDAISSNNPSLLTRRAAYWQYQQETSTRFSGYNVGYRAHNAYNGWQPEVWNWRISGILQQTQTVAWAGRDMQGIQVRLDNLPAGTGVAYRGYVRGNGWQNWVNDGALAGTVGQSLSLDGLQVTLTNPPSNLKVCYQAYLSSNVWQAEVCDGQTAGVPGGSTAIAAMRIRLVTTTPPPPPCEPVWPQIECEV